MASLAGIVAAILFTMGYPIPVAVGAALLVGLAGGVFNGALVSLVGILPFVATLATLTMFSGLAFIVSGGKTISGRAIPEAFGNFARDGVALGPVVIPNLTIVAAIVVAAVWVLLEQTTFGRRLYAIGGNIEAAHLSGVPVKRLKLIAFSLTGLSAAGAGLLYASRVASANPTQGSGLMLNAIAAVFLGMTMSEQGEPRILATIIGVLILGVLDNGLTQMNVDSYVRQVLVGAIIVIAVAASSLFRSGRR
jgi:ribose transport system permease protein